MPKLSLVILQGKLTPIPLSRAVTKDEISLERNLEGVRLNQALQMWKQTLHPAVSQEGVLLDKGGLLSAEAFPDASRASPWLPGMQGAPPR